MRNRAAEGAQRIFCTFGDGKSRVFRTRVIFEFSIIEENELFAGLYGRRLDLLLLLRIHPRQQFPLTMH